MLYSGTMEVICLPVDTLGRAEGDITTPSTEVVTGLPKKVLDSSNGVLQKDPGTVLFAVQHLTDT
jgi:hypothetical protein